jgi:hypothetical protein
MKRMTGPEAYDALSKAATAAAEATVGNLNEFEVHPDDVPDLCKLTTDALISLGYGDKTADSVSTDLDKGSIVELGKSMGYGLTLSRNTPRLQPEK